MLVAVKGERPLLWAEGVADVERSQSPRRDEPPRESFSKGAVAAKCCLVSDETARVWGRGLRNNWSEDRIMQAFINWQPLALG